MRVFVERKWKLLPTAERTYSIYWFLRYPEVLAELRFANAGVSLVLYGMCGLIWYWKAALR